MHRAPVHLDCELTTDVDKCYLLATQKALHESGGGNNLSLSYF